MELPSDLTRMEIQGVMAALGYAKSLLPTAADVYVRENDRIAIHCDEQWKMPLADFVRILLNHELGPSDIEAAYNSVYRLR